MVKLKMRKNFNEYKAVILDMDGTLYMQSPLRLCMFFELLLFYVFHFWKVNDLFSLISYRRSFEKGALKCSSAVIDYWMREAPLKYIYKFRDKNLLALVNSLCGLGIKVVVYSDYPVKAKIAALRDVAPDFAFCAEDAGIRCLKPCASGLLYIIELLRIAAADVIFIGDRFEKDGLCAEAAGVDYIILSGSKIKRNLFFRRIENGLF